MSLYNPMNDMCILQLTIFVQCVHTEKYRANARCDDYLKINRLA